MDEGEGSRQLFGTLRGGEESVKDSFNFHSKMIWKEARKYYKSVLGKDMEKRGEKGTESGRKKERSPRVVIAAKQIDKRPERRPWPPKTWTSSTLCFISRRRDRRDVGGPHQQHRPRHSNSAGPTIPFQIEKF